MPRVESDTELRKGAPPSYNDALRFTSAISDAPTSGATEKEQLAQQETSLPPYPVSGTVPSYPPTSTSNLPYPDTSSAATPYPPIGNVGAPYPHANIASAPYSPAGNIQGPYPQDGHTGSVIHVCVYFSECTTLCFQYV